MAAIPLAANKRELIAEVVQTEKRLAELQHTVNPSLTVHSRLASYRMYLGTFTTDIKNPDYVRGYTLKTQPNIYQLPPAEKSRLQLFIVPAGYEKDRTRAQNT